MQACRPAKVARRSRLAHRGSVIAMAELTFGGLSLDLPGRSPARVMRGAAGEPSLGRRADQAVSLSPKASGVMSMWNSIPSTLASLDNVASDGS